MTGLATLSSRIAVPHVRDRAVDACERLVSREVEAKRGLSGAAIRAGHAAVLRIKPTMVRDVLRALLPAFAEALEPFWHGDETEGAARVEGFVARLSARPEAAAEALLGVTDERIDLARPAVRRGYQVLRPSALAHVRAAVPGLADALREALSAQPGT